MANYTVFLGFQVEAADGDSARTQAYNMVEGTQEFPSEVACVGLQFTPFCTEQIAVALVVLGKSLQEVDEEQAHASN